uniref:Uncharacterized protein n=1 Tax=Oryza glumipatula TaxID=40148 RepID=A0A0E0A1V5_9ORYZ
MAAGMNGGGGGWRRWWLWRRRFGGRPSRTRQDGASSLEAASGGGVGGVGVGKVEGSGSQLGRACSSAPATYFFSSQASALAVFLHLPYHYPNLPSFSEMGKAALLRFPGMPPIRTVDMPATLRGDESEVSKVRLYQFKRMTEAKGVL